MKNTHIMTLFAAAALASCASVTSKQIQYADGASHTGLQYSAPKALFDVNMQAQDDTLFVTISDPYLQGDPNATFSLNASAGAFSDQRYSFSVNPDSRLLSMVKSESIGRLDDIIIDLAKAAGGVTRSYETGSVYRSLGDYKASAPPQLIYHRVIDPMMQPGCEFGQACSMDALSNDLQAAAAQHLRCADAPSSEENRLCKPLRNGERLFQIDLSPMFTLDAPSSKGRAAAACKNSICYRSPVPYEMRLRVAGVTDVSQIVQLPNKAPILNLKIPAGVFADTKAKVALYKGMPVHMRADKDSDAAVAAGVPLQVVDGFFTSASRVLALRVDYNSAEARALQSETALDEARRARQAYLDGESGANSDASTGNGSSASTGGGPISPSASNELSVLFGAEDPVETTTGDTKIDTKAEKMFDITIR